MTKLNQNEKNALSVALWNYGQDFCNPYDFKEKEDIKDATHKQKILMNLEKKLKKYFNYDFRYETEKE